MIVPQNVINNIHRVEFSLSEPLSLTTLWAYPVGDSYDYRLFLAGQWTSVANDADSDLAELIQRAELAIKAANAAATGAENVNAALVDNVLTITDREGNTTSLDLSSIGGGGYVLPSGGIPTTDLSSDVQTSLGKADSALQSHQDLSNYIQKNDTAGLLKNDGTVDTNTYLTQHQDISGKAAKVVVVDGSTLPASLDPNKVYQLGTLTGSVTIPAFASVQSGDTEAKIWCFTFSTSTTAPTITWPAGITGWSGGSAPTINASKSYEVTVMDGIGVLIEA